MEMMLFLREENEIKAEARLIEEDRRRREELELREARYQAEKRETEDRRRQDLLEREELARARTQQLVMLIGVCLSYRNCSIEGSREKHLARVAPQLTTSLATFRSCMSEL
ncbi:hypothetical protein DVH05_020997 [Phytophthora capsici]|nr:hypothetical protein DVH05_020997 [Phytophthora capsici]